MPAYSAQRPAQYYEGDVITGWSRGPRPSVVKNDEFTRKARSRGRPIVRAVSRLFIAVLIVNPTLGKGRQCPLWVKSRHVQRKNTCPLYPQKRTYLNTHIRLFVNRYSSFISLKRRSTVWAVWISQCLAHFEVVVVWASINSTGLPAAFTAAAKSRVPIADSCIAAKHCYSNTSSARPISVFGMVRPRALAVFRLMYSSTLVACWTGRSAGLSPLRTRPV